ncbi:cell wall-binding repeat-containing protein [Desulfosporosinus hippei]|uniref:Listeria/Bacterioides repeat-containing protein n=1 Tax=Desulfosporosinus hippei DSM 8344 TaxID=1121419 RepID=A0A1G8CKK3_9FIRM|nr:cell wall-binding repeat-containing protein [Desulfosporosinus hippei]SDH45450.1 Listeria/Bacterioides repeat-containing protein [Desulfosporosinus hippei DSM 8344]
MRKLNVSMKVLLVVCTLALFFMMPSTAWASSEAQYSTDGGSSWTNSTFKDAFAALNTSTNGGTIKLLTDVTWNPKTYGDEEIRKNITIISGNGARKIQRGPDATGSILFRIDNTYTLTLGREGGMGQGNTLTIDGGAVWTGDVDSTLNRGTTNSGVQGASIVSLNDYNSTFKMYEGVTLQNNQGRDTTVSSAVKLGNRTTFNMYGGEIKNMSRSGTGGAVHVANNSAAFTMWDTARITGCSSDDFGGAVASLGTFTMNGGTISGNIALSGAGVTLYGSGTLTMNGGTITGNKVSEAGKGAGVYVSTNATIKLNGNPTINGNIKGTSTPSNVFLTDNIFSPSVLIINEILTEAKDTIGITGSGGNGMTVVPGYDSKKGTNTLPAPFFSDDPSLELSSNGSGGLKLSSAPPPASMPTAIFEASTMTLSNVENGMKYSVNGGTNWIDITTTSVVIADVTTANGIKVYMPGNGTTTRDSDVQTITVTQAATPVISTFTVTQPSTINGTGSIAGVQSSMEYSVDNGSTWTAGGSTITGISGGTTYSIRTKGSGAVLASEAYTITINAFSPMQETKPVAIFEASTMTLSNVATGMKYSVDGGTNWLDIPTTSVVISDVTTADGIKVYMPGNGTTTLNSDVQSITVTQAATPVISTFTVTQPSTIGGTGSIAGITASMEYSLDSGSTWTAGGSIIIGISGGATCSIRTNGSGTVLASEPYTITINAFIPTKETEPVASFEASTMTLSNVATGMKYSVDGGTNWLDITTTSVFISDVTTVNGIKVYMAGNGTTTLDSDVQTITVTQAATPASTDFTVTQPSTIGGTGSIEGVLSTMEYSLDNGSIWTAGGSTITDISGGTTYSIRTKGSGMVLASEVYTITMNVAQAAPTGLGGVAPTTYGGSDGKITGTTTLMEYQLQGAGSYTAATETEITGLTAGTYNVRYAAKEGFNAGTDAEVVVAAGPNEAQAAPTGLAGVAPTSYGGSDGKITGTTTLMEYQLQGADSYKPATEPEITGLAAGTYEVRYAAKTGFNTGAAVTVTVPTYKTPLTSVSISGTAKEGQILTATVAPSGATANVTYQWQAGGIAVGTNAATYTVQAEDIGKTITVTATGTGSYSGTVTSTPTSLVTTFPITAKINNGSAVGGNSLEDVIAKSSVELPAITSIDIIKGSVTSADWDYMKSQVINLHLTSFRVADTVTSVADIPGGSTFQYRVFFPTIRTVDIAKLTSITAGVFNSMEYDSYTALTTVNFPDVTSIGNQTFFGCTGLTTANFPKAETIGSNAFSNNSLETADFPAATSIGASAFSPITTLKTANFPAATKIENSAFARCTSLTTVNFPVTTSIEGAAFYGCTSLTTVNFPVATSIENSAFGECTSLITANFPVATSIGTGAFYGCTGLTTANFPMLTSIGTQAFYNCSELAILKLPALSPTVADANVFKGYPLSRTLSFVDTNGIELTGAALTTAQNNYKAVSDGDTTDSLWYGWYITQADGPALTGVTSDDAANTMTGMTAAMEFSTDGTTWTAYNAEAANLPDLTGTLALQVRVAETATHTAGPATTFNFTVPSTYTLTVNLDGGNSITGGNYIAGSEVAINAGTKAGYTFSGWITSNGGTFANATLTSTTFTMPAAATTITATWTIIPSVRAFNISDGTIKVANGATAGKLKVTYGTGQIEDNIDSGDMLSIIQTNASIATANTIAVNTPSDRTVNITLSGVNIDVSATSNNCAFDIQDSSVVNLVLTGSNTLQSGVDQAGLQVQKKNGQTATVTINGTGTLNARSGESGDSTFTGGGAGIGGGKNGAGGNINIIGGNVTGTCAFNSGGAGIGGGDGSTGGTISISGGIVTAEGGYFGGAGIGGGRNSAGGTISISGTADVKAKGGNLGGAGLGGGQSGAGGIITISDGTVRATGYLGIDSAGGAGIGAGTFGAGGVITISGGTVTATGGQLSAGIGGTGSTIKIDEGATVIAVAKNLQDAIDADGIIGASGSGKTVANILMANYASEVDANTATTVKNGTTEVATFVPTSAYKSIAYTVPTGSYTVYKGATQQTHSDPANKTFEASAAGLNAFSNLKDDISSPPEPQTYSVTFTGGSSTGATGAAPTQAATAASGTFQLPANPFTRTGYTFAGWNDGTMTYDAGTTYTMSANDVTFTAQWTADTASTYTVTVNLNGGNGGTTGGNYTAGAQFAINAGTKAGYTFSGWITSNGGTFANATLTSTIFMMPANEVTITAQWTENAPDPDVDPVPGFDPDGPGGKPTPKPGENPGETEIVDEDGSDITPAEGNRFVVKISSSVIATPKVGDQAPTGEGVTDPYTPGSPISGVDAEVNRYIGFYEVDSDNKVVRFELITLGAGDIKPIPEPDTDPVPGFDPDGPGGKPTPKPGTDPGTTEIVDEDGSDLTPGANNRFVVKVSNQHIAPPNVGDLAPVAGEGTGVIDPYTLGADIPGVDAVKNKYIGFYEVDSDNKVVRFELITLGAGDIKPVPEPDPVPGFDPDGPGGKPTPKPGENPGETEIVDEDGSDITPAEGNRFVVKVSSSIIATPKVGDQAPTGEGVTDPYTPGNPISGVDAEVNRYIGFYEVDSDNKVVRFELITLGAGDIKPVPEPDTDPVPGFDPDGPGGKPTPKPGTDPGTTEIVDEDGSDLTPGANNRFVVKVSNQHIAPPNVGDLAPVAGEGTGVIDPYTLGADIPGVDAVKNKYIGFYEVDSDNKVVRFELITLGAGDIKPVPEPDPVPGFDPDGLGGKPTPKPGENPGTIKIVDEDGGDLTPGAGNRFIVKVSSSSIVTPNVGDLAPIAGEGTGVIDPYTLGADIPGVDAEVNRYIGFYEVDSDNKVVLFELITIEAEDAPNTHTVSGTITDTDGKPVSGATVTLTDTTDNSKTYTGTTDANGNYSIPGVPDGTYTITVTKGSETLGSGSGNVTVNDGDVTGGSGNITVNPPTITTAQTPVFSASNVRGIEAVTINAALTPLTVTAAVTDSGALTYQWYQSTTNSTTVGTPISGQTSSSYTPPTDIVGTTYYYVVVTNTATVGGETKTSTNTSSIKTVIVLAAPAPTYDVSASGSSLSNITLNNTSATQYQNYTTTLSAASGYTLPSSITITMGGVTLVPGVDYIYTKTSATTGTLTVYNVTGELSITAVGVLIPTQTYTIRFNSNDGSIVAAISGTYGTAIILPTPTKPDFNFAGWYRDSGFATSYLSNKMGAENITLHAKWEQITYEVTGNVKDEDDANVNGATVKLMAGSREVVQATTDANGVFTISGIPRGIYNLVISKGTDQIITLTITVSGNTTTGSVTLPKGNKNSVVEVKSGTPDIIVDKLNDFFASNQFTQDDSNVIDAGGTVEIRLIIEQRVESGDNAAENAQSIITAAGSGKEIGIFLNLSLSKIVTPILGGTAEQPIPIRELDDALIIDIPLPAELQGKSNYVVYRYHGTEVQTITQTNTDGEYIELSADGKSIKLHTKKFSTYAIGYTVASTPSKGGGDNGGGTSTAPTITSDSNPGGKVTVSSDQKAATITPDEGYIIFDVLVDGKSVGAIATYTFTDSKNHTISAVFVEKSGVKRLAGVNRVDTALEIAKASYEGKVSNVVLATAENYPDALAGSVLAYKLKAPILLVGSTETDQEKVLDYLKKNLDSAGTVYILGGTAVVSSAMEAKVANIGCKNITRLGGTDQYETSVKITDSLEVKTGTPLVLVSGENYPDALSISSTAGIMQAPILLVQKDRISEEVKQKIATIRPEKVYIIGLEGVVSAAVESDVAQITSLDPANIIRIGGADRYETSLAVAQYFNLGGQSVCIATGSNFPDALAGSVYAANFKAPILLVDGSLSDNQINYLKTLKMTGATLFGGEAVITKDIEEQLRDFWLSPNLPKNK